MGTGLYLHRPSPACLCWLSLGVAGPRAVIRRGCAFRWVGFSGTGRWWWYRSRWSQQRAWRQQSKERGRHPLCLMLPCSNFGLYAGSMAGEGVHVVCNRPGIWLRSMLSTLVVDLPSHWTEIHSQQWPCPKPLRTPSVPRARPTAFPGLEPRSAHARSHSLRLDV